MRVDALTPIGPAVPGRTTVVCTSEADALHLCAAAGHVLNVCTSELPPASRRIDPAALVVLETADPILILAADDEAGERIADALARATAGRSLRLFLPDGRRSVAELREQGEVLAWLCSEWARYGCPWPEGMLERHEAALAENSGHRTSGQRPETTRHT